uniref:SSD domain-containing protein n=1 Tax=Setaria digitata TaxID=48799 RepID=A0A915Q3X8_9BILA
MRLDFVQKRISQFFEHYIILIIRYPWPFILIPVAVTTVLCTGLQYQQDAYLKDELDQYVPIDALARRELQQLDELFHIDDLDPFYATRRYDIKRMGYIIVRSTIDDGNVLKPVVLDAVLQLWNVIQRIKVEGLNNTSFDYASICVKFPISPVFDEIVADILMHKSSRLQEKCVSNPLIAAFKMLLNGDLSPENGTVDKTLLKLVANSFSSDLLTSVCSLLGGIIFDEKHQISGAKAMMLPYALRHSSVFQDSLAEKWELKLADFLPQYASNIIKTSLWTYETIAAESIHGREQLMKMLFPCFLTILLYTVVCCCLPSWIYSRPWLAAGGVISAASAVISAIGLLLLLGYHITSVAYLMPFIIFSVGVDNVFITLSTWRSMPLIAPFEFRMKKVFSDATVSITVTSFTDLISFTVGCFAPFQSVRPGMLNKAKDSSQSILVLTSKREFTERHCLTFRKVKKYQKKTCSSMNVYPEVSLYKIHTVCWPAVKEHRETISNCNHLLANFFRTTYSDWLLKPLIRLTILLLFILYLITSIWGCMHVKLGLEPNDLLSVNSYGREAISVMEKYFSDYGSYLHVWMYDLSKMNFSNRQFWTVLEDEIALYEYTEYTGPSDSWLRTMRQYFEKSNIEITSNNFVYVLKNIFLSQPQFARYKRDILFDSTGKLLEVSRILVQLRHVGTCNQSRAMRILRNIAKSSSIKTGVYADFFQFAEQYNAVLPATLSTIAIASLAVIIVSLVLIPKRIALLWVPISIVSVNLGILGFMTIWNVRLDFVSMITIVMSVGFCVDFASHLAFNFAKGKGIRSSDRMRNALYNVGVPIVQSASSTIIGVSFLISIDNYVFRSFLKTIILVITIGALHSLLILPIFLTLFNSEEETKYAEPEKGNSSGRTKKTAVKSPFTWSEASSSIEKISKGAKHIKNNRKTNQMTPNLDAAMLQTYWNDRCYYPNAYEINWNREWTSVSQEEFTKRIYSNFYPFFIAPRYGTITYSL